MTRTTALRPAKVAAPITAGAPALYVDERGRRHRVLVTTETYRDTDGTLIRQCSFLDELGKPYEVAAGDLEPCDDRHQPLAAQPADLATPRGRGVETADYGAGRVYAPEPFRRRAVVHPPEVQQALARYDRSDATPPLDVQVNRALMTPDQVRRYESAIAKIEAAKSGPHRNQRRLEARAVLVDLQRELSDHLVELEVAKGNVETIKTANRRGEEVNVTDRSIRVNDRDGLRSLYEREKLTTRQYDEGMRFREGHQARSADLGSQMGNEGPGAGHRHEQFVATRAERAFMLERNARIRRAVALQSISHPSALQMLDWVAGEGQSISAFGKGRTYERNVKALVFALDLAIAMPMKRPETAKGSEGGG